MYKNYLRHPIFGKLWYEVSLRNWTVIGQSALQNLEKGPLFEMRLLHGQAVAAGRSLEDVTERMMKTLDAYAERSLEMKAREKINYSWLQRWKINRMNKRFLRDGIIHPVEELID